MKTPYEIIAKKRDGKKLTQVEIEYFLNNFLNKKIGEGQMAALLMAIYLKGLTPQETFFFTKAMLDSGKNLSFKKKSVIDKHSTGGVGDKTSFVLMPIAAACGIQVPMIAGRALGHTGGTIDKIESIKGFKTNLNLKKFQSGVLKNNLALIGQTKEIAPADGLIYSLRDVTGTIESIPLITASIMSKKLAEGASGYVMDVKYGSGAFMPDLKSAKELASSLEKIGILFNKNIMTVISDMSQPLGNYVGHSLEIFEAIETLKGHGPKDLTDLSIELAAGMIYLGGKAKDMTLARKKALKALTSGKALEKFREMVKFQGGNIKFLDDYRLFEMAETNTTVKSRKSGFVKSINAGAIGLHLIALGGGRKFLGDKIDHGVGFHFHKKVGDKVKKGDSLLTIFHHNKQRQVVTEIEQDILKKDIKISSKKENQSPLIYKRKVKWGRS
ncbi:MAG: thymidine phosphorylase [Epsilonproteobacteria bacterium]|nr:MAG: thymidine phosphorylase [Campylobacterota bacterium]RLA65304.1 MAG: thymidine phosphorylase [Campylobacterota bacterium]